MEDEVGEGVGQYPRRAPELEPNMLVFAVHVVESEATDRRGALGVEGDQEPGDSVLGFEGTVAQ
ncbi:hypothetical protein [Streptomyces sp. NRRL S-350]|uniref:hypothetical protein n=1 Tax=Streptomyces sp. NRRL S-350 TaxID=1463902 RepID=UPI00131D28A4|nr:hypothetical protein [Streptomyces sp. NRRL S-350]